MTGPTDNEIAVALVFVMLAVVAVWTALRSLARQPAPDAMAGFLDDQIPPRTERERQLVEQARRMRGVR